ncbi:toll/interleukin-1 receptor domain-containing protein [Spirosoma validum]|uniref:Toll/interleukin-1 receptor domain-containing protein n=1 Tax=Spirosoma validum TaxID=2771355 RepID=A0A927B3X8_9BACT|nr:toll/interleukin-1 receptor domain-containing protein [Spirosoma validum]MBD2754950.1 toll/interleukin-1 receptor domain-containing protein [Spirosoma validum]
MELLSQIIIPRPEGNATIQLLSGDLTDIPKEFAVDILAISAFRGDYRTTRKTLMNALFNVGISVADLAEDKEVDLVNQVSCWLSKPLTDEQQAHFNIKKILCFEPVGSVDDVDTEVGNLFRAINTFAIDAHHDDIAMPVLTTGDRGFPIEAMLPALLETAIFWLETGLPLKSLKLVLHRDEQVQKGLPIFETVKELYDLKQINEDMANVVGTRGFGPQEPLCLESSAMEYDYFISYSHKHTAAVQEFVNALRSRNPSLRIFYDRSSIPSGGLWIRMISDAIQHSKNVICVLTPEYSQSKVCWDEFQCAYIMESRKKLMIRTINFCNDADLPPMMAIYSYIDCTEGNVEKFKAAAEQLEQLVKI